MELVQERNFDTLLIDSIDFLVNAYKLGDSDEFSESLSRGSVIFSILMLEAAANICIETLILEKSVFKDIDKLSVLAKFDFYLRVKFEGGKLNKSNSAIEGFKELKILRDRFVHLKPHEVEWKSASNDTRTSEPTRTHKLKIANNPKCWAFGDAIKAMKGVHEFLSFFFKEQCKYPPENVSAILFSEETIPGGKEFFMPYIEINNLNLLKNWQIDLSYLKLAEDT